MPNKTPESDQIAIIKRIKKSPEWLKSQGEFKKAEKAWKAKYGNIKRPYTLTPSEREVRISRINRWEDKQRATWFLIGAFAVAVIWAICKLLCK